MASNPIYPRLTSILSSVERKSFLNNNRACKTVITSPFPPILNKIRIAKRLMRFPSFEQTVLYFCLSEEAINILAVIRNGDYADDINYHYFQLLHPARPCRLWGQLPEEEPPPAVVHSLAEPSDCATQSLSFSAFLLLFSTSSLGPRFILSPIPCRLASPSQCQWVREASHTVRGRPKNEWGEVEVDCETSFEEIPVTDTLIPLFFLSFAFALLSQLSSFVAALVTSLSLGLFALSSPFPLLLTPDTKHPFPPHEIWRDPSWIVYRLAACMPMAAGGQAQVVKKAAAAGGWGRQGRTGPTRYAQKPVGSDYPGSFT